MSTISEVVDSEPRQTVREDELPDDEMHQVTRYDYGDESVVVIGDNNIIQNVTQYKLRGTLTEYSSSASSEESDHDQCVVTKSVIVKPELRLILYPDSPVFTCVDQSVSFPRKNDHKFELCVFKNTKEILPVDFAVERRWRIDVSVRSTAQDDLACRWKPYNNYRMKGLGKGKYGFWFRFQRKDSKYEITFSLKFLHKGSTASESIETVHEITAHVHTIGSKDANSTTPSPTSTAIGKVKVNSKRNNQILSSLIAVLDTGSMLDFEKKGKEYLLDEMVSRDNKAAVLLEFSKRFIYEGKLESAESKIHEALKTIGCSEMHNVLVARAHVYLSDIHRRQKQFGKSQECIQIAEQNLHCLESTVDQALLLFEKAARLVYFAASSVKKPNDKITDSIVEYFEECFKLFLSIYDEIPVCKAYFSLLCLAKYLLDCRTRMGRARSVSLPQMQKAETCLRLFKERFPTSAPTGLRIQYLKAYSDLHYRKDEFEKAVKASEYSLKIAKKYQFNTEIGPLEGRIESYRAKASATLWKDEYMIIEDENSSGDESAEETDAAATHEPRRRPLSGANWCSSANAI